MPTDVLSSIVLSSIRQPILIASHPRSGTHLTIDFLRKQFSACASWKYPGEPLDYLYLALEGFTPKNSQGFEKKARTILKRCAAAGSTSTLRPLFKTHAYPQLHYLAKQHPDLHDQVIQNATQIYVVRDGRSVLCSFHLFMQSFAPATRCPISEFLRQQVNGRSRVKAWADHVEAWMAQPNVHLLKFEDLIHNPQNTLESLGTLLDLTPRYVEPLLPRSPKNIWQGRWARLTQWQPESTAIIGYYQGQKTQKWKEAFTESDRAFFHQEAGDLLIKLGYVDSDAWVSHLSSSKS